MLVFYSQLCSALPGAAPSFIVYDQDDRVDPFQLSLDSPLWQLKRSVAVIVKKNQLTWDGFNGLYQLPSKPLAATEDLCYDQKFFLQPSPGSCTAFAVDKNLVATAGHCVKELRSCSDLAFVFNFSIDHFRQNPTFVSPFDVYYCDEVLFKKTKIRENIDFALLRLNRDLPSRDIPSLRREGKLADRTSLTLIGHPSGLPQKIVNNGRILNNSKPSYFMTEIDAFAGNSGSPVFNNNSLEVEGMLIRGSEDYQSNGSCNRVRVCRDGECSGETITRVSEISKYKFLCQTEGNLVSRTITGSEPIPDNNSSGTTLAFKDLPQGKIKYLGIRYNAEHTNTFDVSVFLIHPDGRKILLSQAVRDDRDLIDKSFGYGGEFLADLEDWVGLDAGGDWQLQFVDEYAEDLGTVLEARLTVLYDQNLIEVKP